MSLIILIISLVCVKGDSGHISTYFTPENVYSFAEWLYAEGDYSRARGEFNRYLYIAGPSSKRGDTVIYRIGRCWHKEGNFLKAVEQFKKIKDGPLFYESIYQIALSYYLGGYYQKSNQWIASNPIQNEGIRERINLIAIANYAKTGNWKTAYNLVSAPETTSLSLQLMDVIVEGLRLPEKSPAIAGLLSSVVPGAGKIYSGRSIDGIQSFITVGATALQAYLGFRKDGIRSIRGWISSSVGVVFYLGNIYGSVIAARIHNEEKRDALLFQIDGAIISLCLSSRL